jgi:hypothetical protein
MEKRTEECWHVARSDTGMVRICPIYGVDQLADGALFGKPFPHEGARLVETVLHGPLDIEQDHVVHDPSPGHAGFPNFEP